MRRVTFGYLIIIPTNLPEKGNQANVLMLDKRIDVKTAVARQYVFTANRNAFVVLVMVVHFVLTDVKKQDVKSVEDQVFVRTEGRRIDVKNVLVPDFVYTVVKS